MIFNEGVKKSGKYQREDLWHGPIMLDNQTIQRVTNMIFNLYSLNC